MTPANTSDWHPTVRRACRLCAGSMIRRRSDAKFCSSGCRTEASRLRRLLAGETVEGYDALATYLDARWKRANERTGA